MNHQYRVITHCLKLLHQSQMADLKKQRVAFRMIQLKRLLSVHRLPEEVTTGPCSAEVFDALLAEMGSISRGEGRQEAEDDLLMRLDGVLVSAVQMLKEHAEPPRFD